MKWHFRIEDMFGVAYALFFFLFLFNFFFNILKPENILLQAIKTKSFSFMTYFNNKKKNL